MMKAEEEMKVTVSGLNGDCKEIAIAEADTGDTLIAKVRTAMTLPASAEVELYLSQEGTPIDPTATLASQGIGDGAELSVVVPTKAALTDLNIRDAVERWFDPGTMQAVVEDFGKIGNWNVGEVTDMSVLFKDRAEFNEDLSRWDTGRVTDMSSMFEGASSFNQPVEAWDTHSVRSMAGMFHNAPSFDQPVEKWNTSRVEDMAWMFEGATSFNQPLNAWNIGSVEDIEGIFERATSLKQYPIWYIDWYHDQ